MKQILQKQQKLKTASSLGSCGTEEKLAKE